MLVEALLASFLIVFLAEMGDKTQFLVMAFAAKYEWKQVFAGMTLGILVVHSLAVAVGALAGELIPAHLMAIFASLLFLGFGIWTLRGDDDEEEEAYQCNYLRAPSSRYPLSDKLKPDKVKLRAEVRIVWLIG